MVKNGHQSVFYIHPLKLNSYTKSEDNFWFSGIFKKKIKPSKKIPLSHDNAYIFVSSLNIIFWIAFENSTSIDFPPNSIISTGQGTFVIFLKVAKEGTKTKETMIK